MDITRELLDPTILSEDTMTLGILMQYHDQATMVRNSYEVLHEAQTASILEFGGNQLDFDELAAIVTHLDFVNQNILIIEWVMEQKLSLLFRPTACGQMCLN